VQRHARALGAARAARAERREIGARAGRRGREELKDEALGARRDLDAAALRPLVVVGDERGEARALAAAERREVARREPVLDRARRDEGGRARVRGAVPVDVNVEEGARGGRGGAAARAAGGGGRACQGGRGGGRECARRGCARAACGAAGARRGAAAAASAAWAVKVR